MTKSINQLSPEQYLRYNRHLLLSEVGVSGQKKLLQSKILIVGLGGLGSPAAIYLAAAGIGSIGLVEFDTVDISNLQRQILYTTSQIGLPKIVVVAERLKSINPDVNITTYPVPLTFTNAPKIFSYYDYILDATDNLASRYIINDTCVLLGKKYIFGSIYNFEGRVSVFGDVAGPCYRCVFPESPRPENIPGSLDSGVLGMLPGIIGTMQATEIVKLICNIGEPLIGRMILYDALTMSLRAVKVERNKICSTCGSNRVVTSDRHYDEIHNLEPKTEEIKKISANELHNILQKNTNILIIDVRDNSEIEVFINHALNIPINELRHRLGELKENKSKGILIYCQTGSRGLCAAKFLIASGFCNVSFLDGGMSSWINAGLPVKSY